MPELTVCSQLGFPMLNDAVFDAMTWFDHIRRQLVRVHARQSGLHDVILPLGNDN